jgi:hypothetical protein
MDAATVRRVEELTARLSEPRPLDAGDWAHMIEGLLVANGASVEVVRRAIAPIFGTSPR